MLVAQCDSFPEELLDFGRSLKRLKRQSWPLLEALQKTCGSFVVMLANQKLMIETMQGCHRPEKLSSLQNRCESRKDHGTNFLTILLFSLISLIFKAPPFSLWTKKITVLASFPGDFFHQAQWESSFVDQQSVFQDEPHGGGFRVWTASWGDEGHGHGTGTTFCWLLDEMFEAYLSYLFFWTYKYIYIYKYKYKYKYIYI